MTQSERKKEACIAKMMISHVLGNNNVSPRPCARPSPPADMADIVNLKQVRKQKARAEKDNLAEANRLKFGRSKSEKELLSAKQDLETRKLDAHKRDDS